MEIASILSDMRTAPAGFTAAIDHRSIHLAYLAGSDSLVINWCPVDESREFSSCRANGESLSLAAILVQFLIDFMFYPCLVS